MTTHDECGGCLKKQRQGATVEEEGLLLPVSTCLAEEGRHTWNRIEGKLAVMIATESYIALSTLHTAVSTYCCIYI